MAGKFMNATGVPSTITSLKQHNSQPHSKYSSLYSQISGAFTPWQRSFILQQVENIAQQVKCREQMSVGCLSPTATSTTQLPFLRLREHHTRGGKMIKWVRGPGHQLCNIIFYIWQGAVPIKILRLSPPEQNYTMTTLVNMPTWIGKISQGPTPRWRVTGNQWLLRKGESDISMDASW